MRETKFKQTDIGLIPEDWDVTTLGEISQKPSYGVGAEAIPFNGYDKYIRITDIDDSNGAYVPNPIVSPSFYSDQHIVRENDLLVARTGASVGKSYLYNNKDGKLIYAGFLMKLNISGANSQYTFYTTRTSRYLSWVASESARTGQPGLNIEQLKSFQFAIPSHDNEQRKIAKALSDIDGLISSLTKLIEKKQNIKTATMQQLLTGKKRLEGFTEPWVEKEIGSLCMVIKGEQLNRDKMNGDAIYPVYNGGISPSGYHSDYNTAPDTVIISEGGNSCGFVNFIHEPFWRGGHCYGLFGFEGNNDFFYQLLKFREKDIMKLRAGSGLPNIQKSNLSAFVVEIPNNFDEQTAIANILSDMDNEISALGTKKAKYESIKKGMMQELLTGRIRLV